MVRIEICEYNPGWPEKFEKEKWRINGVIGDRILSVDHIGSTSVNGLGAKPIIDIMVGVECRETADICQKILESIGYDDVTPQPGHDEWFYCLGRGDKGLYYHVHLVIHNSEFHKKHLIFRNYLREQPVRTREYYHLKKKLAREWGGNRRAYTEAKTSFIEETIKKAKEGYRESFQ
jgi:GrpB-like predicted nucleotidyltransferase (UPF0157 family)